MILIKTEINLMPYLTKDKHNHFWNIFTTEVIEANHLQYGGLQKGTIEPSNPQRVLSLNDKSVIESWLKNRSEIKSFKLSLIEE